jgi:hypothetical protein
MEKNCCCSCKKQAGSGGGVDEMDGKNYALMQNSYFTKYEN